MEVWHPEDVQALLASNGFGAYARIFKDELIDGRVLSHLSSADLRAIGIPMGNCKRILQLVEHALTCNSQMSSSAHSSCDCNDTNTTWTWHFFNSSDYKQLSLKGTKSLDSYGIREQDMTPSLMAEFQDFFRFMTEAYYGQQEPRISTTSAGIHMGNTRLFMGYVHKIKGVPLDKLSIARAFPKNERNAGKVAFDYVQWLAHHRHVSPHTEATRIKSLVHLVKFCFRDLSTARPDDGDKPFSDILPLKELRKLSRDASARARTAPPASNEDMKSMPWSQYLEIVEQLRRECALVTDRGFQRREIAVAMSFQRYLIAAILSSVPDRQRTIRELEVGRTLLKDPSGCWVIKHGSEDYKTGHVYGDRPPLIIAKHITPYLEEWLSKWRAVFNPSHKFCFTQKNGKPHRSTSVYSIFRWAMFHRSGKMLNPHYVRDLVVTHFRATDAPERDLEALAIYMGHSVEMQKSTYDRRSKSQKVAPAVEMLNKCFT